MRQSQQMVLFPELTKRGPTLSAAIGNRWKASNRFELEFRFTRNFIATRAHNSGTRATKLANIILQRLFSEKLQM